ncbi:MAG TPA: hypothetical protein VL027_12345 [Spongiibacteraceae bacterium]|nr:hypothetical protein [Spongiibacteraceae bacterium]
MEVATLVAPIVSTERLQPLLTLTDAERAVWIDLVNDQPASAFTATHAPLLAQYCRHIVQSQLIADEISNFDRAWLADDDGLKRYDRLLAMQEREGRAASSLATRLRITRQATADPKTVGRAQGRMAKSRKPWELAQDE